MGRSGTTKVLSGEARSGRERGNVMTLFTLQSGRMDLEPVAGVTNYGMGGMYLAQLRDGWRWKDGSAT